MGLFTPTAPRARMRAVEMPTCRGIIAVDHGLHVKSVNPGGSFLQHGMHQGALSSHPACSAVLRCSQCVQRAGR